MHRIVQDKNAQLFKYIKLRIQENFLSTFYTAFQQLCHFMIPSLLTLMYIFKLMQYLIEVEELKGATFPTDAHGNVKLYQFPKLEALYVESLKEGRQISAIDILTPSYKEILNEVISEISSKGIVPSAYYVFLVEFSLVWFFVATLLTSFMALVYYRKFKSA